jgi:hypothetical protein
VLGPGVAYNHWYETSANHAADPMNIPGVLVAGLRKRFEATHLLDAIVHGPPGAVTGFVASQVIVVGCGNVIADAAVDDLFAAVAGIGQSCAAPAPSRATGLLGNVGSAITGTGPDTVYVAGPSPKQIVAALIQNQAGFPELAVKRETLEDDDDG